LAAKDCYLANHLICDGKAQEASSGTFYIVLLHITGSSNNRHLILKVKPKKPAHNFAVLK